MKLKRKRFSDLKESSKISWIYSAITITLVTMAGGIFYALSSNYIENLYFKYLSEKAHAVAIERFEKDELDPVKYRNVVLHRQNSIPTSHQLFVDMEFPEKARNELKEYLSNTQIADVIKGEEVFFHRGDEVGTAFIYYDNEGTYVVVVLSRNPYGVEISRVIGWILLIIVCLSVIVLYLISRLYAIKVVDRIYCNYRKEKMFVNNASHEINNPLTAIQGECDIALLRERNPEEYRRFLQKISYETTRVIDIMQNLLRLSHTYAEKIDRDMFEWVDVGNLMQQYASSKVNVKIENNFHLMTQESLLSIALRNLVDNAMKYAQEQPVEIRVSKNMIEIKDHGIGISSEDLPYIFEPFYRAKNAVNESGYGIGLALSKEIISKLGGRLTVNSKLNEGSCFVVLF